MESLLPLVYILLGLLIGATAGYFAGIAKGRASAQDAGPVEKELEQLHAALHTQTARLEAAQTAAQTVNEELRLLRESHHAEARRSAALEVEKTALEERMREQKAELDAMQQKLSKDFELLANRIFEEKTTQFSTQSRTSIAQVLEPLRERLREFEKKVEEANLNTAKENSSLREEIRGLKETSQRMSRDAENLVKALKHETKVQGNWGEMILERLLENSGLVRDREYFVQQSFTTDDGSRLQPDVVVKLPENKVVVIDSKVSLVHYERYVNEEDKDAAALHLRQHLQSIRNHLRTLAGKKYQDLTEGQKLDFVLMFVPVEPAYLAALHADQELFNEAFAQEVVLVSPTMLLATMKVIAAAWRSEYQNRNAQEIARRGALLYDKFVSFTEDLVKIGDSIDRSKRHYDDAVSKLNAGKGNLISQAKTLESLGVHSRKRIHQSLLGSEAEAEGEEEQTT
jgi:DNA recombination protein RmuC